MSKPKKKKHIAVIGGGTGTSIVLRGLKKYPVTLSAIVTTSDTGGSSGALRREIGVPPTGDIRQCFIALNEDSHPVVSYLDHRFRSGKTLGGHSFGNLFLALLWQHAGDFQEAMHEAEKIFNSKHSVVPVTTDPTDLVANLKDGKRVRGEVDVIRVNGLNRKLKKMELLPKNVKPNPKALEKIKDADYIVIGPGNIFGSLTPPFLVPKIAEAVCKSSAKKIYVSNLMNQKHLTAGFYIEDYIDHLKGIFGRNIFDFVIYNNKSLDKSLLKNTGVKDEPLYFKNKPYNSKDEKTTYKGVSLVNTNVFSQKDEDPMQRTLIRHDSGKLAKSIFKIIK